MSRAGRVMLLRLRVLVFSGLLLPLLSLSPSLVFGEMQFRATHYKSEDGLPTNLTKAVLQDHLGFLWTATDSGLVRYDGRQFSNFSSHLPSELVKDVVRGRDGRSMLVVSDGGVTAFHEQDNGRYDSVSVALAGAELDEEHLQYPKTVYEDGSGRLWASERRAVTLISKEGSLRRYWFEEADFSESIGRSFLFAEDAKGSLFVSSQRGSLFHLDPATDTFRKLALELDVPLPNIFAMLPVGKSSVYLGTSDGVFVADLSDLDNVPVTKAYDLPLVSSLAMNSEGILFAGTWRTGVHYVNTAKPESTFARIRDWQYSVINDLEIGNDGRTLWISSDQGIGFVEPAFFASHLLPEAGFNIGVHRARDGSILASDMLRIFEVSRESGEFAAKELYIKTAPESHMGAYALDGDRFVIGYNGFFEVIEGGTATRHPLPVSWFVEQAFIDRHGNAWLTPLGIPGVARLTPESEVVYYLQGSGMESDVHAMTEGTDGTLYACAGSGRGILYRYDPTADSFTKVELVPPSELRGEALLRTFALDQDKAGTLWLATNRGLFRVEGKNLKVPAGAEALVDIVVKSVVVDPKRGVWAGTDAGLFLWTEQGLIPFDAQDGLADVSINYRGLSLDRDGRLWVGSANGLSSIQDAGEAIAQTPAPRFLTIMRDGFERIDLKEDPELPHHSFIEATFISVCFPGDRVRYERRIFGKDEAWVAADPDNYRTLKLPVGEYRLQLRAQQKGRLPSPITEVAFSVAPAWYRQWWVKVAGIAAAAGLLMLLYNLVVSRREKLRAEEELEVKKERYQLVALGSNDGMWDWDLQENTLFYSPRWKEMIDCAEEEIGDSPAEWFDRVHPDDRENVNHEIELHKEGVTPHLQIEYRMRRKDGSWRWVLTRGVAVRDRHGRAYRMAGSQTDITRHKKDQEALLHASLHDPLTHLPNRTLFCDRLENAIARARRHPDALFALLFLDLNKFKEINDTLGHLAGDELLREIASRLQECLREGDTVARFGGDEFAILLDQVRTPEDAIAIAERFGARIKEPMKIFHHEVSVSASIGITIWNRSYETTDEMLSLADAAMYKAKKSEDAELVITGGDDEASP